MRWFLLLLFTFSAFAVRPDLKNLPIGLAPNEVAVSSRAELPKTAAPIGPIHSLAEWETATHVMTLWTNPSLLKALSDHGKVLLFADSRSDENWWLRFLENNGIDTKNFSFFLAPTDSIWIRDYGPWFILDGNGAFGLVDTKYNRPRPLDDEIPLHISKKFGIPYFQPGLVHTGGNYYNDALGNAFSSTLVYSENSGLGTTEVNSRMEKYLGIERYTTSRLSPGSTIQHLDTFGKLVSPDTWVFSEFPEGSQHKKDSDTMVEKLKELVSPYGTPYKIHRLKMVGNGGNFRAYLNSFISNRALYFPAYGDSKDLEVKAIYQKALPGYDIVPVDAMNTQWGDSVHCRTRNLLTRNTVFVFPKISQTESRVIVKSEVIPSLNSEIVEKPKIFYSTNGGDVKSVEMEPSTKHNYQYAFEPLKRNTVLKLWIEARDSNGNKKTAPHVAPENQIEYIVQ